MAVLLVLVPALTAPKVDDPFWRRLGEYTHARVEALPGAWLVDTREAVEQVRDKLASVLPREAQVLVLRVARRWAGNRIDDTTLWLRGLDRAWTAGKQAASTGPKKAGHAG
jgi:hypothetical protein